ncbi:hypothetical protein AB0C28_49080 [Nonomuraea sp. NPDC048892]|uniref:hypothetical protein n=1 Tax=Nonomuraea sp. NPDC048892 TaxID=3154624 RepID=UPI0033E699E2
MQITDNGWKGFLDDIKGDSYKPAIMGKFVAFMISDERLRRVAPMVITTADNWRSFVTGVKAGKFDELPPVPLATAYGQWMTKAYGAVPGVV